MYGVPENMTEFYPLGGTIISDEKYSKTRDRIRGELLLKDNDVLIVQADKLGK